MAVTTTSSSSSSTTATETNVDVKLKIPWIFCHFQKDKLKYGERYHQQIATAFRTSRSTSSDCHLHQSPLILIPDGPFLRKYLSFFEELLQPNISLDGNSNLTLLLLESAAEYMDLRNSSPCIHSSTSRDSVDNDREIISQSHESSLTKEASSINERNRIMKLWQKCNRDSTSSVNIVPFSDLTYRNTREDHNEDDDFDMFSYADMSVEDRSRCSLVRAAHMYNHVLSRDLKSHHLNIHIVLLTEDKVHLDSVDLREGSCDKLNIVQALDCSGLAHLLQEKVNNEHTIPDDHWVNLQQNCEEEYGRRNIAQSRRTKVNCTADFGHSEYVKEAEQKLGLKQKRFFKGKLKVSDSNPKEAYVSVKVDGENVRYFLNGNSGHFNRALHEDLVIIEPLSEEKWEQPIGKVRLMHESDGRNSSNNKGTSLDHQNSNSKVTLNHTVPTAHVVAMHNNPSQRRKFVATLQSSNSILQRHESSIIVVPMDKRISKIRIKTNVGYDKFVKKRLLVGIDGWDVGSNYPRGHFVKIMGEVGDLETEISCLLIEHGVALASFSPNALSCLPSLIDGKWSIPDEEIRNRRDLRKSLIFSVDPPGCQDIDDAMHAKILKNGDIEVGVHIADVCYFLSQSSALDIEASKRATTFYLVDRRFDMLPSLLSSDLCSLHGKIDRLAVSVIWIFSSDLKKVRSVWYGRTVIHNVQAMTYDQAHNILQGKTPDGTREIFPPPLTAGGRVDKHFIDPLKNALTTLTRITRKLRSDREIIGGAVDLSSGEQGSELKFVLDSEGKPTRVVPKKELEIHHTIAEMMIMANSFVAKTIHTYNPNISLLRIHRAVEKDNFGELESLLHAGGMNFDGRSNKSLAHTLKSAKANKEDSHVFSLFQSVATRAMTEAQYICTGSHNGDLTHYGLGIGFYTHFTSPIRRYADIVVHRLLLASMFKRNKDLEDNVRDNNFLQNKRLEKYIPESQAISVLEGEGLRNDISTSSNYISDSMIVVPFDKEVITTVEIPPKTVKKTASHNDIYEQNQLAKICENLNGQNRKAKTCAFQCQRLFLSLYFRNNADVTPAVVLSLRENGMICYVPKYDFKGPIFLVNREGHVQIDPQLLGISKAIGLPPNPSIAHQELRIFPEGQCILNDANNQLELKIPSVKKQIVLKCLDVITIELSCNISESTSRVSPPCLHLKSLKQSKSHQNLEKGTAHNIINSKRVQESQSSHQQKPKPKENINTLTRNQLSIFHTLSLVPTSPSLDDNCLKQEKMQKKCYHPGRVETIAGRIIYSDFKNGNSLSVMPILRQVDTLEKQALKGSLNAVNRLEKEATARIQRLAAVKRNSRRTKGGKK